MARREQALASAKLKLLRGRLRAVGSAAFKGLGFAYVALDLLGYRTGSMNEALIWYNTGRKGNQGDS